MLVQPDKSLWHPIAVSQHLYHFLFYSINHDSIIVPCAIGNYYDKDTKTCKACPLGTYQSESGQLQCLACPVIAGRPGVTVGPGARSAADCKGIINF